jgi:hypothetical protein
VFVLPLPLLLLLLLLAGAAECQSLGLTEPNKAERPPKVRIATITIAPTIFAFFKAV